jgi:nitroreductase
MEIMDAIYHRRAVRDYTEQMVERPILDQLVDAAIQAPSALDEEAWFFAVIQGRRRLRDYSDRAKMHFRATFAPGDDPQAMKHDVLADPQFNIFYNAATLVVIYAQPGRQFATVDCCLAAQNLMLAAHGLGLGTSPIGFAQAWLDLEEVKMELDVATDHTAVLPLIVGYPAQTPPPVPRKKPGTVFSI